MCACSCANVCDLTRHPTRALVTGLKEGGAPSILQTLINRRPCSIYVGGLWSRVIGMSGHNCPPSHASPFSSVACMKETKGQRWTWSHDNRLTGSVAKGIGDKVAQTWGDKVMAWGDRKVTRWGQRWVTASDQLHCIMFCPSSSLSVFLTVIRSLSVHLSCLSRTPSHTPSHLWTLFTSPWQEVCVWLFCLT